MGSMGSRGHLCTLLAAWRIELCAVSLWNDDVEQ